jgi:hypothetical protein
METDTTCATLEYRDAQKLTSPLNAGAWRACVPPDPSRTPPFNGLVLPLPTSPGDQSRLHNQ